MKWAYHTNYKYLFHKKSDTTEVARHTLFILFYEKSGYAVVLLECWT